MGTAISGFYAQIKDATQIRSLFPLRQSDPALAHTEIPAVCTSDGEPAIMRPAGATGGGIEAPAIRRRRPRRYCCGGGGPRQSKLRLGSEKLTLL
jgi:hypothetical protein